MEGKEKNMVQKTFTFARGFALMLAACSLMPVLQGCRNSLQRIPGAAVEGGGRGTLVVSTETAGTVSRTVAPDVSAGSFDEFRLDFFKSGNTGSVPDKSHEWDGSRVSFSLEPGQWRLEATGYIKDEPVARGEVNPLLITAGQIADIKIALMPVKKGQGLFVWRIDSLSGHDASGFLEVVPKDAGAGGSFSRMFKLNAGTEAFGSFKINTGDYEARITLDPDSAVTGDETIVTTVLHIYRNMESSWEWTYTPSLSLLDYVLESWNGSQWDFDKNGITKAHLDRLCTEPDPQLAVKGFVSGIISDELSGVREIAAKFTGISLHASDIMHRPVYDRERFMHLIDAAIVSLVGEKKLPFTSFANQKVVEHYISRFVDSEGNGTILDFDWSSFADPAGRDVLLVTAGPYRVNIDMTSYSGGNISTSVTGPTNVKHGSSAVYGASITKVKNPVFRWEVDEIDANGNATGQAPAGVRIAANGDTAAGLDVDPGVSPGTRFAVRAVLTNGTAPEEGEKSVTVIQSSPQLAVAAGPSANAKIFENRQISVDFSGGNFAPGNALTVNFADPGVVPGEGNTAGSLPVGIAASGTFSIDPHGVGSGTLVLSGMVANTSVLSRSITVKISDGSGSASASFRLTVEAADPGSRRLEIKPMPQPASSLVIRANGASGYVDIEAYNFTGFTGTYNFAAAANGPAPVVSGLPSGVSVVSGSSIYNDAANPLASGATGSGQLILQAQGQANTGSVPTFHTLTVSFGQGGEFAQKTFTLEIEPQGNTVQLDSSGILHWPSKPPHNYSIYADGRHLATVPSATEYNLAAHDWSKPANTWYSGDVIKELRVAVDGYDFFASFAGPFTVPPGYPRP